VASVVEKHQGSVASVVVVKDQRNQQSLHN
jgi:hypothetical protein